ncbi:MAG: hypothetical protein F4057_06480 [Acidobacteria bacterium]|nr:hypothetical protein [Acidobacteriota bacterium]
MEEKMPRIEELRSKAHDLYWQIEDWMSDFDIPEERVNDALSFSAQLDDELARLAKDAEIRKREEARPGSSIQIDGGSISRATRS